MTDQPGDSQPVDYEDLTSMQLDPEALASLVEPGGECIFNWTNAQGYPVGVVVAYVWRDGKFWTTCADRRKRAGADLILSYFAKDAVRLLH